MIYSEEAGVDILAQVYDMTNHVSSISNPITTVGVRE